MQELETHVSALKATASEMTDLATNAASRADTLAAIKTTSVNSSVSCWR